MIPDLVMDKSRFFAIVSGHPPGFYVPTPPEEYVGCIDADSAAWFIPDLQQNRTWSLPALRYCGH